MARFDKTSCSQCGGEFGPGDQGYSHCEDHAMKRYDFDWGYVGIEQRENEYGDWVRYEDALAFYSKELDRAYAEGRKDEAEENEAGRLIDAWAAAHGKPVPWAKAVEIVAIVKKLPDAERSRLLALGEAQ